MIDISYKYIYLKLLELLSAMTYELCVLYWHTTVIIGVTQIVS